VFLQCSIGLAGAGSNLCAVCQCSQLWVWVWVWVCDFAVQQRTGRCRQQSVCNLSVLTAVDVGVCMSWHEMGDGSRFWGRTESSTHSLTQTHTHTHNNNNNNKTLTWCSSCVSASLDPRTVMAATLCRLLGWLFCLFPPLPP
jgi:hypothetical protein